jgi:cytochrome c-type biogenesis protein CcmH/NrfG
VDITQCHAGHDQTDSLRSGRAADAEEVYRDDLRKNPENGWALMGLRNALLMQGQDADAAKADARFRKAWA